MWKKSHLALVRGSVEVQESLEFLAHQILTGRTNMHAGTCRLNNEDSHVLTARGVRSSPNFLCPGARGFEFEKFSTVLNRNFSICFKETGGSLKSRYSCAVSYHFFFAKPVDVHCIFNNIDHFRPFRPFRPFRSLSSHPKVTLLMLDYH